MAHGIRKIAESITKTIYASESQPDAVTVKIRKITKEAALAYHSDGRPGKIEVVPTKPYSTQTDLSLAYSRGVAEPCLEIQADPQNAYKYTDKGNLVAVISNGTAVLGLGDIGAMSGKPVMEGKGLLFKIYGGIDVFDIEIDEKDPDKFCEAVKAIAPTFGGINLEDIKAPECFHIEKRLKEELDIPVMHDDQHGTAVITLCGNSVHILVKLASYFDLFAHLIKLTEGVKAVISSGRLAAFEEHSAVKSSRGDSAVVVRRVESLILEHTQH